MWGAAIQGTAHAHHTIYTHIAHTHIAHSLAVCENMHLTQTHSRSHPFSQLSRLRLSCRPSHRQLIPSRQLLDPTRRKRRRLRRINTLTASTSTRTRLPALRSWLWRASSLSQIARLRIYQHRPLGPGWRPAVIAPLEPRTSPPIRPRAANPTPSATAASLQSSMRRL